MKVDLANVGALVIVVHILQEINQNSCSIKREIGHLCHDEQRPRPTERQPAQSSLDTTYGEASQTSEIVHPSLSVNSEQLSSRYAYALNTALRQRGLTLGTSRQRYPNALLVSTRHPRQRVLSPDVRLRPPYDDGMKLMTSRDFLDTLDDSSFFTPPSAVTPSIVSSASFSPSNVASLSYSDMVNSANPPLIPEPPPPLRQPQESPPPILPAATKTEKFLLTAADQESGSRNERLNRVIHSKYEAGLLKPYNYVKGYARLSRWMDRK